MLGSAVPGLDAALFNTHRRWCFHSDSSSGSHLSWQSPRVQPVPQRSSEKRERDRNRKRGMRQGQAEKEAYVRSLVSALYKVTSAELAQCLYIIKGARETETWRRESIGIIRPSDETMWWGRQEALCAVSEPEPITALGSLCHIQILPWVTLLANSPDTQTVPRHSKGKEMDILTLAD